MKTAVFDLETSGLYTNFSILLCCSVKPYLLPRVTTFRADDYKSWKTHRSEQKELLTDIMEELETYDISVAHNGQFYDKPWLNTMCLKYGLKPSIRWMKFVDPVRIARNHLRLGRNTLDQLIDYLDVPHKKTHLASGAWLKAAIEGDRKSMDYIVEHCILDVKSLECVYDKCRPLIENLDKQGSAR
jgi:uncharacterized protein YprB with RNaseH-like and TPR domain